MAALGDEQQYALNCLWNQNKNKTLIFVKLTDSALKAIEDHLPAKENVNTPKPTIQFQSNSNLGTLCFPVSSDGERRFSFTLSNVDSDGPQGSFEFIRQNKYKHSMDSMGNINYKMQIHATEDSYQKTKVRMAVVNEESKRNSTKVIKDTGPNVGRKVKVKKGFSHHSHHSIHSSSLNHQQHHPGYINHNFNSSGINNLNKDNLKPISPPTLKLNGASMNSNYANKVINSRSTNLNNSNNSINNTNLANNSNNSNTSVMKSMPINSPVNTDVMKRPLRERIIHLLALRPYKKPELLAKLMKDGFKEKDKKGLSALLSQVSILKENAYQIAKHAWHEVQTDDWPYYSAEDRENIRKKNPLLTVPNSHSAAMSTLSPLSSDCSSLQESPSPPSLLNLNVNSPSNKRPIDISSNNQKRLRISHLNNSANNVNMQQHQPPLPPSTTQQQSQPNQPLTYSNKTKSPTVQNSSNNCYSDALLNWENKPQSPELNKNSLSNKNTFVNSSSSSSSNSSNNNNNNNNNWNINNGLKNTSNGDINGDYNQIQSRTRFSPDSNSNQQSCQSVNQIVNSYTNNPLNNANITDNNNLSGANKYNKKNVKNPQNIFRNNLNNSTFANEYACSTPNSSPDSGTGSNDGSLSTTSSRSLSSVNGENNDFTLKYVEITCDEQRCKYKSDFVNEYEEYRRLHRVIDEVVKKFSALEDKLNNTIEGSDEWNNIMNQIEKEYEDTKSNEKYLDTRRRVYYLHNKLSHIKKLIHKYDQLNPKRLKESSKYSSKYMRIVS